MRNIFLLFIFGFFILSCILYYIIYRVPPKKLSSENLYYIAENKMKKHLKIFSISYESYKLVNIITDENITLDGKKDELRPSEATIYGYTFKVEREKPLFFLVWVDEYGNVLSSTFDEEY